LSTRFCENPAVAHDADVGKAETLLELGNLDGDGLRIPVLPDKTSIATWIPEMVHNRP
jgi:hypothetical protein